MTAMDQKMRDRMMIVLDFFKKEMPIDIKNLKDRIDELANILHLIDETLTNIQAMEESLMPTD